LRQSNFGLQNPSPKSAHRKAPVSLNVRPQISGPRHIAPFKYQRQKPLLRRLCQEQLNQHAKNQSRPKPPRVRHQMKVEDQNNIAAAILPSFSTAAPYETCRLLAAQTLGHAVALTQSQKCSPLALRAALLRQRSQFVGAGFERLVPCQRSVRPRHFALGSSSGIITSQASPFPSPVSVRAVCKVSNALRPNRSLNRTHCGIPSFAPPFHSGSNAATPQRAG